jgi:hypothetical protein
MARALTRSCSCARTGLCAERLVVGSQIENVSVQKGGWKPALALVFLAPFIAEVLSGATKVSVLFALVPEMMVWGCGALLIRELVRRWGGGWPSGSLLRVDPNKDASVLFRWR